MKWKIFLPTWLIMFLLAPSILIHRIFMLGARPPGSPEVIKPIFIPFGVVYFGRELWRQLVRGDFMDSLVISIFLIVPILIYTFLISFIIYYSFMRIRSFNKIRNYWLSVTHFAFYSLWEKRQTGVGNICGLSRRWCEGGEVLENKNEFFFSNSWNFFAG